MPRHLSPTARRTSVESNGFMMAVACVAAAMLLYLVVTLVWVFDDVDASSSSYFTMAVE